MSEESEFRAYKNQMEANRPYDGYGDLPPPPDHEIMISAPIRCSICGMNFSTEAARNEHVKTEHPSKPEPVCPVAMVLVPIIGGAVFLTAFLMFLL